MSKIISIMIIVLLAFKVQAQNVGIGTLTPDASAMLELKTLNKGLLIPRISLTDASDITTIAAPVNSLLVYNNSTAGIGALAVSPGFYFFDNATSKWIAIIAADNKLKSPWFLGGNNATSTATNFLGTTDNQSLLFKINNTNAGHLGIGGNTFWGLKSGDINNTGFSNVAIGNYALNKNIRGANLVAVGDSALLNNGTGAASAVESINNTAIGSKTLYANTIGSYNTAMGYNALFTNSSGSQNTATGVSALFYNSSGLLNTADGINSLFLNTTGSNNSGQGANSLVNNTTGNNNTANGFGTLFTNISGFSNVAVGANALRLITDLSNLVAIGDSALFNNGTGASSAVQGSRNTAVGSKTLFTNSVGYNNTGIGYNALFSNISGNNNTATGMHALRFNSTGISNTAQGMGSLEGNVSGSNNTANGFWSLVNNSFGNDNTANGFGTLYSNTKGYSNVAVGTNALRLNKDRSNLVAIGDSALFNNGTGATQPSQSTYNTAVGSKALYANTTGYGNSSLGFQALQYNVSGIANTALGVDALQNNTAGNRNNAIGISAMLFSSLGNSNNAFGCDAFSHNFSGNRNIAIGDNAMNLASAANYTVAIGDSAMYNYQGGDNGNTAVGSEALLNIVNSVSNTAIGRQALYSNKGSFNTALGDVALYSNTLGNYNTALGATALYLSTGDGNSAIGQNALNGNNAGSFNTAVGMGSMYNNTSGNKNVAIGTNSLGANGTGNSNTAIGNEATVYANNQSNSTAIGANAQANCSNCLVLGSVNGINLGSSDVKVGIGINTPLTALHVSPNGAGSILIGTNKTSGGFTTMEMGISAQTGGYGYLQTTQSSGSSYGKLILNASGGNVGVRTINPLSPFHIKQSGETYPVVNGGLKLERLSNSNNWELAIDNGDDLNFNFNGVSKSYIKDVDGVYVTVSDIRTKKDIELIGTILPLIMQLQPKTYHYRDNPTGAAFSFGFIAQEVEKLFPDFVTTKGNDNMKALSYQNFGVIAIKALQEQQSIIDKLNKRIEKLEHEMELHFGK